MLEQERREADAQIQGSIERGKSIDGIGDEDGREHGEAEVALTTLLPRQLAD